MKKIYAILIVCHLMLPVRLLADEGMWLLPLLEKLNITTMNKMGLALTAEDIYSVNKSSLKDAIVVFGGGCTGEIVSPDGLLFTNHHCGRASIHQHSTVEHDYLRDGYWALARDQELPTPGLFVTFLVRMEDVTDRVNKALKDDMSEKERAEKIEETGITIAREAIRGTHYIAVVREFFGGNQFYLLVFERYNDVRLVGAPPASIGNFGADTDNWMWPRHTGDFSIFRVYMSPDGKPAAYSPENVPLKPRHYLPVSIKGVKANDFAMVIGNPGATERYITSWEVKTLMEHTNPNLVKIRGIRLDLMREDMLTSPEMMTKYRAKFSGASNYWKYAIGQNKGLKDMNVIARKQQLEKQFAEWVSGKKQREKKYGETLALLEQSINGRVEPGNALQYLNECFLRGAEITGFARRVADLHILLNDTAAKPDAIRREADRLRSQARDYFRSYSPPTDRKVLAAMMKLYYEDVKKEYHPEYLNVIAREYDGQFGLFADEIFSQSIFADQQKFEAFLDDPRADILENEKILRFVTSVNIQYSTLQKQTESSDAGYRKGMRLFIAGLMEMQKDHVFYPDANSTFRLTYGTVSDYSPRDAVRYNYYTTLTGVMEKEVPGNWEFSVPEKLKEIFLKKDYGKYGMGGAMPVCFITNNDITGGNSGSPVLNGNGELIGLAFDGNWEAMSGDVIFEPELQKCICVDIRYVLLIIDKFAGATNIINELDIRE